jgi:hypothetical protein
MTLIEEIKSKLKLEVRSNSKGTEYLEAVVTKKDLESVTSLLTKHLGTAAKEPGKQANLSGEIQKVADWLGGLRLGQSFFYKKEGTQVFYAALWPWESNPDKITLKTGVLEG